MVAIGNTRSLQGAGAFGQADNMIVLFTDFGSDGPYAGQMKAVLHQMAPGIPIIDLFADAPVGNPKASAYLLAAYAEWFAAGTVFLGVVDPGARFGDLDLHRRVGVDRLAGGIAVGTYRCRRRESTGDDPAIAASARI